MQTEKLKSVKDTDNALATPPSFTKRQLFGGALEALVPKRMEDVSKVRVVPDHQEVFADADTDQSVIFEINQYASETDADAPKFFMTDYADASDAKSVQLASSGTLSAKDVPGVGDNPRLYAVGEMVVTKGRDDESAANRIQVYMAIFRLKQVTSDFLVIFNVPVFINPSSQSANRSLLPSAENQAMVATVLNSLKIKDWSLFAPHEHDQDDHDHTMDEGKKK